MIRDTTNADDTDPLVTLSRHGATVLSDAADRLTTGPQPAQWYEEQAATCGILATMFTTRAEHLRRAPISPERMVPDDDG
jgi:hypothetical protein